MNEKEEKQKLCEEAEDQALKNSSPEDVKAWADFYQKVWVELKGSPNLDVASLKKSGDWKSLEKSVSFTYDTAEIILELGKDCLSAEAVDDGSKPVDWLKKRLVSKQEEVAVRAACRRVLEKAKNDFSEDTFNRPQSEGVKVGVINDIAGWVYVIKDMDSGLYKIGKTDNWERRFKQLKVDGQTIQVIQLRWVEDRHSIEKYHLDLHAAYRLPQSEWFKLNHPPIV